MQVGQQLFDAICARLFADDQFVEMGLMMNAPALTYRGRAFAFLTDDDRMVFRLDESYQPAEKDGLRTEPFFSRLGALPGWYAVSHFNSHHWEGLVWEALELLRRSS